MESGRGRYTVEVRFSAKKCLVSAVRRAGGRKPAEADFYRDEDEHLMSFDFEQLGAAERARDRLKKLGARVRVTLTDWEPTAGRRRRPRGGW